MTERWALTVAGKHGELEAASHKHARTHEIFRIIFLAETDDPQSMASRGKKEEPSLQSQDPRKRKKKLLGLPCTDITAINDILTVPRTVLIGIYVQWEAATNRWTLLPCCQIWLCHNLLRIRDETRQEGWGGVHGDGNAETRRGAPTNPDRRAVLTC